MSKKEDSILPADSSSVQSDTTQKGSVADMMLGKSSEKVIDSDNMIKENQQKEGWAGFEVLEAEMPGCELLNLIIEVKSLTEGLGSFDHEFERMQTVQNKQLSNSLISEYSSTEKAE